MSILLANPRGFCAGVDRAIEIVEKALQIHGAPIYVRHEVVHNKFVVDGLKDKGAVFVAELDEVPDSSIVIFSAHGVSKAVEEEARRRELTVFDATCPLVTKVHLEVLRHAKTGRECILIGHEGHPEVEGTMGRYEKLTGAGNMYLVETPEDVLQLQVTNEDDLAFVTQTTLSMDDTARVIDALRERFPNIIGPKKNDICYATQNRQDAVKGLAEQCQLVLVVGSPNSSNSNRLREVAERMGDKAYLIDNADEIQRQWLDGMERIGISAGASAPEILVQEVITRLQEWGCGEVENYQGEPETIIFPIPKALQQ
ncbi:MAG: 4-hydroxy-3-methylbut-2-enyl diphosphate reductase [Gammaproteobacteria bacterium]|nr:4-hydroxy-3-methylbut-2-enyl diphosphate reductase [Gammaproteobacteria bacterium]